MKENRFASQDGNPDGDDFYADETVASISELRSEISRLTHQVIELKIDNSAITYNLQSKRTENSGLQSALDTLRRKLRNTRLLLGLALSVSMYGAYYFDAGDSPQETSFFEKTDPRAKELQSIDLLISQAEEGSVFHKELLKKKASLLNEDLLTDEAINVLDMCVEKYPDDAEAHELRGSLLLIKSRRVVSDTLTRRRSNSFLTRALADFDQSISLSNEEFLLSKAKENPLEVNTGLRQLVLSTGFDGSFHPSFSILQKRAEVYAGLGYLNISRNSKRAEYFRRAMDDAREMQYQLEYEMGMFPPGTPYSNQLLEKKSIVDEQLERLAQELKSTR